MKLRTEAFQDSISSFVVIMIMNMSRMSHRQISGDLIDPVNKHTHHKEWTLHMDRQLVLLASVKEAKKKNVL